MYILPPYHLSFSKSRLFLFIVLISYFRSNLIYSQTNDPFHLTDLKKTELPSRINLFQSELNDSKNSQNNGIRLFQMNPKNYQRIKEEFNTLISVKIPIENEKNADFIYTEYDFFTPDFNVNILKDGTSESISVDRGIHLKGKMDGDDNSFSSLSIFSGEIYGSAYLGDGHHLQITPIEPGNPRSQKCIIADENKLILHTPVAGCFTDDILQFMGSDNEIQLRTNDNCKSVNVSVDIDYDLFLKFNGNVQSITNYITGLFNNVHTLYKRESISIALAQINIHAAKDNFAHISASEDLENFRKKYPNTNKTLKIILSGYSKLGQPTLGGIANINTICMPTYSYGFANVGGTYLSTPLFSWDIYLVTHELGHILGSRHTHACVWGPKSNQAIDNCAKLEGTCPSPGIPTKGTMMSYCYLTGMPGIDFTLGFGVEPGNLIRQKVKSSSCLSSYIPVVKTIDKSNAMLVANLECTDGSYTHYYFDNNTIDPNDDILLLSVSKNGNDIGTISDGSLSIQLNTTTNYNTKKANHITAAYTDPTKPWYVSNKFWVINSNKKPTNPLDIKYYFNSKDLDDLKGSCGSINNSDIKLFNILPPGNPNPESNHSNTQVKQFINYSSSAKKVLNSYILTSPEPNLYCMEVNTQTLASSGFGAFLAAQKFVNFGNLKVTNYRNQTLIAFKTNIELDCNYFILERSKDQIHFDSIGKINARGYSLAPTSYEFVSGAGDSNDEYYRLKACSANHELAYSALFSYNANHEKRNGLSVYPSPVKSGVLFVEYDNQTEASEADMIIIDIYGRTIISYKVHLTEGINYFNVNTNELSNGMHYINVIGNADSQKTGFIVSQ